MFVDEYASMIGASPFPFCFPSYCYLVLKLLMSQDFHHKYNSSQRLKVVRVLESPDGLYYVPYDLTTPMHLNFHVSQLMCLQAPMHSSSCVDHSLGIRKLNPKKEWDPFQT
jgi:hypothetical protein